MAEQRETWGVPGDLELARPASPEVIIEALKALGLPGNVWTEITEKTYSIEIRAYAEGRDAGAAAIAAKCDKLKSHLAPYSPKLRLGDIRQVDDPEKAPDEVGGK